METEVELQGGEDVSAVDGNLVLPSHQGLVQVDQLFLQFLLQEVEVVLRGLPEGDGGSQKLVGVILHCCQRYQLSLSSLQEEDTVRRHSSTLDGQRTALGGLEGEAHRLCLLLNLQL